MAEIVNDASLGVLPKKLQKQGAADMIVMTDLGDGKMAVQMLFQISDHLAEDFFVAAHTVGGRQKRSGSVGQAVSDK